MRPTAHLRFIKGDFIGLSKNIDLHHSENGVFFKNPKCKTKLQEQRHLLISLEARSVQQFSDGQLLIVTVWVCHGYFVCRDIYTYDQRVMQRPFVTVLLSKPTLKRVDVTHFLVDEL